MTEHQSALIVDIDGTLCPIKAEGQSYADLPVIPEVVERLREYRAAGFRIVLATSRNMRTYGGNLGLINANTAPVLLEWLKRNDVPFDEIYFGKPWPGPDGFYVDDRTVRPDEFAAMNREEIAELLRGGEQACC